jgi:urease accessory protein
MWFAAGEPIAAARREALLESAREQVDAGSSKGRGGATSPDARAVVLRVLADRTEPALALLARVWAGWRERAWGVPACVPRVWRT